MKNKSRKTSKKLNDSKIFKGGATITINDIPYTYNVGMPIGEGKFGSVYIATDQENKKYALKIVKSRFTDTDIDILIKNEMNILNKLKEKCNDFILCVNAYENEEKEKEKIHYIVTEYLDGYVDFFDYIVGDDYPTDDEYIKIIDNLCQGLLKIHEQGVAHRDIKPENIMINPKTLDIKYIDFGSSCSINNTVSNFNQNCNGIAGTPEYYDKSIDYPKNNLDELTPDFFNKLQKSDIWSLGMTIFVLLSKKGGAFIPVQSYGYDKFKQIIYKYKNKNLDNNDIHINIKRVMDKAKELYDDAINQNMYSLDLVKAFADNINEREIYSPKKRSHNTLKRSHSSPIHKRSRSSIKRSRSSSIAKRTTQKKSRSSILRSETI